MITSPTKYAVAMSTGYEGEPLDDFMAGFADGTWLASVDRPCWPDGHYITWTPYDDGRMWGWFDGIRPPDATMNPMDAVYWWDLDAAI